MHFASLSIAVVSSVLAHQALAAPQQAQSPFTDTVVLQYALTLEHLENAFYSGGLAKYSASDFSSAEEHSLFMEIAEHEASHVAFLTTALGDSAVAPCNYSFPYNDIAGFKSLAMVLEGVGVTAYLGAAGFISNKAYLTAAGSILTTEARHAAYLAGVNGADPWSGPYDTPLTPNDVFSLAAPFITSCPSTNAALPVKAFPSLTVDSSTSSISSGSNIKLNIGSGFNATDNETLFVAFLTGVTKTFVPYTVNGTIAIPTTLTPTSTIYAIVTRSNLSTTDADTVAGPAILSFKGTNSSSAAKGASSGGSSGSSSGSGSGSTGGTKANASSATAVVAQSSVWLAALAVVGLFL